MIHFSQIRNPRGQGGIALTALAIVSFASFAEVIKAEESSAEPNHWIPLVLDEVDPRFSPALVFSPERKRFLLLGGSVSHQFKGERGYDVRSLDPTQFEADMKNKTGKILWENELPQAGAKWGGKAGVVNAPEFSTPYFSMQDKEGVVRPNPRHMVLHYQYAHAPWDGSVYALSAGHLLRYDVRARTWEELTPEPSPAPAARSYKQSLNWSAICADPVNRELVLFGGCGVETGSGGPGTWVYSTKKNAWRKLELDVEPPSRALAPMAFDPASKKILLFGGDQLDTLLSDTWLYDTQTRTWKEQRPPTGPSPRFGHVLLSLPKSGRLALIGGNTYTSSISYQAKLYAPLPMEMWTYEIAENRWELIRKFAEDETVPRQIPNSSNVAAADSEDRILFFGPGKSRDLASTWLCHLDAAQTDDAGTREFGVPTGTVIRRTESYDPDWYTNDVPDKDPARVTDLLNNLPANRWVALEPPKWPVNRQGGGWSTTAYDSARQQVLHIGGGHSSYFGNDVAHYDTATNRWSISYRPQFALHYNYDLTGPGPWAFNGGPWGNHNYHAYQFDPARDRMVYVRNEFTHMYDPVGRKWLSRERISNNPFYGSKYTSYVCSTPQGVVVWAFRERGRFESGIWRLGPGGWNELPLSGKPLPQPVTDGSTITFDSKRNRLLLTTTRGTKGVDHSGEIWSVDLKSGLVETLQPAGAEKIVVNRFARESVYLPERDQVLLGYHLGKNNRLPVYDIAKNLWGTIEVPGSEFFTRKGEGVSVDLGLIYDARRHLIWAVMCKMSEVGHLQVLDIDASLKLSPLDSERGR